MAHRHNSLLRQFNFDHFSSVAAFRGWWRLLLRRPHGGNRHWRITAGRFPFLSLHGTAWSLAELETSAVFVAGGQSQVQYAAALAGLRSILAFNLAVFPSTRRA